MRWISSLVSTFRVGAWSLAAVPLLFCAGCQTPADYGDAPDGADTGYPAAFTQTGQFPTLRANDGARVLRGDRSTLGPTSSLELDADDPADPDGEPNLNPSNTDSDDGIVDFVVVLLSIPPPASLSVNVATPAGVPSETYWINALVDMNLDGRWGGLAGPGLPEWVVRNFPFQAIPGSNAPVALPPFFYGFGNRLPDRAWMRILLSREPVPGSDWDGTGEFSAGEVEDHVLSLPEIKSCAPVAVPDRQVYRFRPPGAPGPIPVNIRVRNLGATACDVRLTLTRISGGVTLVPVGAAAVAACAGPPAGPIVCTIPALAPGPGVVLTYNATRPAGMGVPSTWNYRAQGIDPPAVITAEGVTIGYGDSIGDFLFVDDDPERDYRSPQQQEQLKQQRQQQQQPEVHRETLPEQQ